MFRTGAQFMLLVLLAGLALMNQSRTEPLATWDNDFADFLAMNCPRHAAAPPVTLVGINDSYLTSHPWPWNPLDFSVFFQSVLPLKPGVVGVDQVLDWERAIVLPEDQARKLPQYEKILRDNILRAPKMLLGSTLGIPDDPQVIPPLQEVPLLRNVHGSLSEIPEYTAIELQPAEAYRLSSTVGFTNLPRTHPRFNSVPLVLRYRGQITPTFPLQAVLLWAKLTPDDVTVQVGSYIDIGKKFRIPIDATGQMRVDFGAPFSHIDFDELALASVQKEAASKPIVPIDQIAGGVVLLSRTDLAARELPLAARRNGSPGELFAAAIATIEAQSFIQPAPSWAQYTVIAVFMLLSYRVPRWKKWKTIFAGVVALVVYMLVALAVFGRWLIWLPGVVPVGVVAVCVLFRLVTPDSFGRPKRPVILCRQVRPLGEIVCQCRAPPASSRQVMGGITFTNLTRQVEIGANCYSLELAGQRIVLDSGLHPRFDGLAALPDFRLLPDGAADAIVLSHAHQDHVGSLPVLMRRQPQAPVFMTEPTHLLSDVMLHNAVNVMMKKREEGITEYPLFTHREVDVATKRWHPVPLHTRFDLTGERLSAGEDAEVSLEFFDAGHILGSVGTLIEAQGRSIFYTGDVQFDDQTIMQGARFPEEPLDVLIIETTRGDRATPEGFTRRGEQLRFAAAIKAAFDRGAGVLIPLFALGKTQEILAMFYEFRRNNLLGQGPIYIGGLGTKLAEIYDRLAEQTPRRHPHLQVLDAVAPFTMAGRAAEATPIKGGRIYALSSGMMTEKTLSNAFARHVLSDPQHALFFVGYADPESPAGRLRTAAHGDIVQLSPDLPPQPLNCQVEQFNFSAHSTRESLRTYVNKVRPKKVVLVHGDASAVGWFQVNLTADLPGSEILVPTPGVPLEL